MRSKSFVEGLKLDLNYPMEFHQLCDGIEKAEQLAQILGNKDSFVKSKIDSCGVKLKGAFEIEDLVKDGLIKKTDIGEIVVNQTFALQGSFMSRDISIRGPAALEECGYWAFHNLGTSLHI